MGALTQLYAGTSEEAINHNGEVRLAACHCSVVIQTAYHVRAFPVLHPVGARWEVRTRDVRRRGR